VEVLKLAEKETRKIHVPKVQLERYFFTRTFCNATQGYKREKDTEMILEVSSSLMNSRENRIKWKISLSAGLSSKVDKAKVPYDFSLTIDGFFRCPGMEEMVEEDISKIAPVIYVTGSSVLFVTAREYLRSITAAGPYGPLILPGHQFSPSDLKDGKARSTSSFLSGEHHNKKLLN